MNPLKQLGDCGQSIWLDYLTRSLTTSGELQTMIERDGLKGMTSNPAIFEKAIGHSDEYVQAIEEFLNQGDRTISEVYEHLAIADIQAAADILKPVFDQTGGRDGYVSLECSPYIANDTDGTIAEALRLRDRVNRPNLMVKVPGTPHGLPAIRKLIGQGLSLNITLLFAVSVYEEVAEAHIAGLEEYDRHGGDVSKVASVASFFVSRIDSAVDRQLDGLGSEEMTEPLRNVIAVANAKIAYARYKQIFSGARWQKLAKKGARTQRLLWASTSTKNPKLRDTMYVEQLIGRDTVNTVPPATMNAFRDHGQVQCDTIEQGLDQAQKLLTDLARREVSLPRITGELVVDGVKQFAEAFDKLLSAVAKRRRLKLEGEEPIQKTVAESAQLQSAIDAELENWRIKGNVRRLWQSDPALWTGQDENKWTGWLEVVKHGLSHTDELSKFAAHVRDTYAHVVLLGSGGLGLGPQVLASSFGPQPGWPDFCVLDSPDAGRLAAADRKIDIAKTLFIVSADPHAAPGPDKGLDHFHGRVTKEVGGADAGRQFLAIAEPGSALERIAGKLGFAHIFPGVPSIRGRYAALSNFGLVPAAAIGLDTKALLESAAQMVRSCGDDVPPACNPGVELGIAWGVAAHNGRNKITIVTSPAIASMGEWLKRLIADSTGKQGRGLIPIAGEPLAEPSRYGNERFFLHLILDTDESPHQTEALAALEAAGHPVTRIHVKDPCHLAQEFFRFQIATVTAAAVLGINPFGFAAQAFA